MLVRIIMDDGEVQEREVIATFQDAETGEIYDEDRVELGVLTWEDF